MASKNGADNTVIIKKYANRRLYDTSTSSYVTLDHLADLVRREVHFEVRDAKSGEDLTRAVLTQIIFERETKGEGALPLNFLRQLIGYYGGGAQSVLPAWLDMSMNSFAEAQERWSKAVGQAANPFNVFERQARRNMEMFESAMRMFTPPGAGMNGADSEPEQAAAQASPGAAPASASREQTAAMDALRTQMEAMQRQLDALSKKD